MSYSASRPSVRLPICFCALPLKTIDEKILMYVKPWFSHEMRKDFWKRETNGQIPCWLWKILCYLEGRGTTLQRFSDFLCLYKMCLCWTSNVEHQNIVGKKFIRCFKCSKKMNLWGEFSEEPFLEEDGCFSSYIIYSTLKLTEPDDYEYGPSQSKANINVFGNPYRLVLSGHTCPICNDHTLSFSIDDYVNKDMRHEYQAKYCSKIGIKNYCWVSRAVEDMRPMINLYT